jgi:hypothetical protein
MKSMELIAPDIMEEVRLLSPSLCLAGFLLGLVLWLTGWWGYRFWVVLAATVTAGVGGIITAPANRVHPLLMGILLAAAAGMLALALVRLVAFGAGGVVAWLAVRALAPSGWGDPLMCILLGGLVGLLLFRLWIMTLTSLAGSVLMAYFGLALADTFGRLNAQAVVKEQPALVNWSCAGVALVGLLVQFMIDRKRTKLLRLRMEQEYQASQWAPYRSSRWWRFSRWPAQRAI